MFSAISECRICKNKKLLPILSLGTQALTGKFPASKDQRIESMPLELVKCDETDKESCGLVQLRHTGDLSAMYGEGYGYRSSLNQSMVRHLTTKVREIEEIVQLEKGDLVVDIGANDATTLKQYKTPGLTLVGVDPAAQALSTHYPKHIDFISDFYSLQALEERYGNRKAKVVTSIAMFYDLPEPMNFMREVYESLADGGYWIFEQSYLPSMVAANSYDTICHEHLEYYGLRQIKWMAERVGFQLVRAELNNINGGSFSVIAQKCNDRPDGPTVTHLLREEKDRGYDGPIPLQQFAREVESHRGVIGEFFEKCNAKGKRVIGYGASTKGNVLLQYCDVSTRQLPYIAEVNEDKFGCFTPGTSIPIISEEEARKQKPDYFFVLPWHFREGILKREVEFRKAGGQFAFPLPRLEIV